MQLAKEGLMPCPLDAQIHVGNEDWQSLPDNVQAFGQAAGIPVNLAQELGHMLGEESAWTSQYPKKMKTHADNFQRTKHV